MNNSKLDIAKDIIEPYYDAIRDKPNKTDFQKGIVRGLNLALQILDTDFDLMDRIELELKNLEIIDRSDNVNKAIRTQKRDKVQKDFFSAVEYGLYRTNIHKNMIMMGEKIMGLDQSFYNRKQKIDAEGYVDITQQDEVLYFRKYHSLHQFIDSLVGGAGNGEMIRLNPDELLKVKQFILEDEGWSEYSEGEFVEDKMFFRTIGVLEYYAFIDKPLYYMGDW